MVYIKINYQPLFVSITVILRFSGREGLIIHQISYKDGDVRRPLFYRNSVAELFIPYGDARPPFHQKYVGPQP